MKLMVGLQTKDPHFVNCICEHAEDIYEVYFSWGDFPNGRNSLSGTDEETAWEQQDKQRAALRRLTDHGIALNVLFNANCYGKDSQSRAFFHKVGMTIDYIADRYDLRSITTTSPLIAKFVKNNFTDLEVRASVNMRIGTVQGMSYLSEYFDSYYVQRECNRDLSAVAALHAWAQAHGKQLFCLANSGCLNHCSAHTFHDNLVAHEAEIAQMDNAYAFHGICHEYLQKPEHLRALIEDTNFIRPEDLDTYAPYFTAAKLATRVHPHPTVVLESYLARKYSGNILDLLEPTHNIYPYVIENGDPLRLVCLQDTIEEV